MAKTSGKSEKIVAAHHADSTLETLDRHMGQVVTQLKRQNSFWLSFVRGMLTGLGASVGVTVVLALIIFVLTQVAYWFGVESLVQPVVDTLR